MLARLHRCPFVEVPPVEPFLCAGLIPELFDFELVGPTELCLWGAERPEGFPPDFSSGTGDRLANETALSAPVRNIGVAKMEPKNRNARVTAEKRMDRTMSFEVRRC